MPSNKQAADRLLCDAASYDQRASRMEDEYSCLHASSKVSVAITLDDVSDESLRHFWIPGSDPVAPNLAKSRHCPKFTICILITCVFMGQNFAYEQLTIYFIDVMKVISHHM